MMLLSEKLRQLKILTVLNNLPNNLKTITIITTLIYSFDAEKIWARNIWIFTIINGGDCGKVTLIYIIAMMVTAEISSR